MKAKLAIAALVANLAQAAPAQQANTIIVMDGSASMWGQIDGRPKLEIARQTLSEVLGTFPAERQLGLLAYGHRRKGDCADIELLVPPAPGQVASVLDAANTMRFQGKTPLTEAVRQAALDLRSSEEAATVILITDGIETCEGDPCALGRTLEAGGVDFTAHVVGFGLGRDEGLALSCLASETGGRYIEAGDAAGLRDALNQTISAVPAPKAAALPPPPAASLQAPETVGRASQVEVFWTGPARQGDYIDVAPFDGAGTHAFDTRPVDSGSDRVTLSMPAELGDYVLRYVQPLTDEESRALGNGTTERSLALRSISVVEIDRFLRAPASVGQGATVAVDWGGPGGGRDYIALYHAGAAAIDAWLTSVAVTAGNPVQIQVPLDPGSYELRYIVEGSDGGAVLSQAPISVTRAQVSFDAPVAVQPGSLFALTWSGPGGPYDRIDVVDPGTEGVYGYDDYTTYSYAAPADGREMQLSAPDAPGTYEIRYVGGYAQSGRAETTERAILYRQPLTVSAEAPVASAPSGHDEEGAGAGAQSQAAPAPETPAIAETLELPEGSDAATQGAVAADGAGDDLGHFCEETLGCEIRDTETGISFFLRPGWATDLPYRDGPGAPVRMTIFDTATGARLSLNAPEGMTEGALCMPSALGPVCNLTPDEVAAMIGLTTLLQTLKPIE
ncbi:VWA domain-containing protein [Oceanicola sp. S124]|uniref:VWA domain-containing protein n=1 Tax=Oceanicola sp. S124 TaxID=1042378 RepID=UPI00025584EF|nr:VWA domain-containing protein [Oceanicola sp. S124]